LTAAGTARYESLECPVTTYAARWRSRHLIAEAVQTTPRGELCVLPTETGYASR
jgi:tRNA A37 threonylcarbamoyladenosine synthetase subunit TsaC/SUA5/YrdC